MAGNQQKPSHVVLPPCRILINEVDSADCKAAQFTPSRLRIPRSQIMPLQQRPAGHPPYTCAGDDDTRSIPDVDSYHADDETSDSEDTSACGLTDDESDRSGRSSADSLRTPQFRSSEVFAKKLPSIAERRQLSTPKVRMPTKSIHSSYILKDFGIPVQSPMELSSIEAYSPSSTHRSGSGVPLLCSSSIGQSSYFQTRDISSPTTGELSSLVVDPPRVPDSEQKALAAHDTPSSSIEKGKGHGQNEQAVDPEQGRPSERNAFRHACNAEHCLKASYIGALFEHLGRVPSGTPPSLTPSLASSHSSSSSSNKVSAGHPIIPRDAARSPPPSRASSTDSTGSAIRSSSSNTSTAAYTSLMTPCGDSPASIEKSSTGPPSVNGDSYQQKPPRRAHAPLHLVDPAVTFTVPYSDGVTKTFGIAVSDILEYEGVYMLRANDTMSPLWEDVAPGTAINLTIHWKGHIEAKTYPIVVKCDCGFIIRRSQLALALAKAQLSYFAASKLDPAYMPPAGNDDPFHPSNFIIKDHHNLHLMSLFTPDSGKTWRTNHAIVEDPSTLTVDPEPERTPSGQLLIPNARVLLAVRRLRAREEMRAQEELRIQELKAQKRREAFEHWKAKQEEKAQKKLAVKEEAEARKQAKKDAKSSKSKKPGSQYDAVRSGSRVV